jgi:hypothetical protein
LFIYLQAAEEGAGDETEAVKGKVVKFGWLDGVFVSTRIAA